MKTTDENQLNSLTEKVIGCAFKVSNTLGCGFLERVYENALAYELHKAGLKAVMQMPINVLYDGIVVDEYFADILIEGTVLVEFKAAKDSHESHVAQRLNYLKATGLPVCRLLNFGKPKVEIKRLRGHERPEEI